MVKCWECDRTTSRPITVTIGLPTGHSPRVQLCPSCYQAYYLPLIDDFTTERPHGAPWARHLACQVRATHVLRCSE